LLLEKFSTAPGETELKKYLSPGIRRVLRKTILGLTNPSLAAVDQEALLRNLERELEDGVHTFAPELLGGSSQPVDYGHFLSSYKSALANSDQATIAKLRADYPIACTFCDDLLRLYGESDKLSTPVKEAMRRLSYVLVPYFHAPSSMQGGRVKDALPRVGFLPSRYANKVFTGDALNGIANLVELLPDRIIAETWEGRPHDTALLRDKVARDLKSLSKDFLAQFSQKDILLEQITRQLQLELGLRLILQTQKFDLMIAGDAGMALPLALLDTPPSMRPPLAFFEHGSVYGDPYHSLFVRGDYFFVNGRRDERVFSSLGVSVEKIHKIGSVCQEGLLSLEYLEHLRRESRLKHGIARETPVIFYATDWQSNLIDRPSTAQTQDLMINVIKQLCTEHGIRPLLYLRYHPSPGEMFFSRARFDYPLDKFLQLKDYGCTVRLAPELDSYLALADCFIAHESSTLTDAISYGLPTLSIDYQKHAGIPILDFLAYEGESHVLLSLTDSADKIAGAVKQLISQDKRSVYQSCKNVWSNIFDCGRTEGMARLSAFFRNFVADRV
jgi:hypothetical protein